MRRSIDNNKVLPKPRFGEDNFLFTGISGLLLVFLLGACSLDLDNSRRETKDPPAADSPPETAGDPSPVTETAAPALVETSVNYDPSTGAVSVTFNFDMAVTFGGLEGWDITPANEGRSLTLRPLESAGLNPGTLVTVGLAVENSGDSAKTTEVRAAFMPVGAVFKRPAAAAEYGLAYYDGNGAAGLVSGGNTAWYYIADSGLQRIFNAVYSPNAPDKDPDTVEYGKTPVPYSVELSEKVVGLFNITVAPDPGADKIEIRGAGLPVDAGSHGVIVIDIGMLGEDNSALPDFRIPHRELGTAGQDYSHIRFRVNRGAYLLIEADNSDYLANGNPCVYGYLTGASVEVMGGAKLRNGAYRGFPLGQDTIVIARLGSWFARGPVSSSGPEKAGYDENRDKWYSGWLLGPSEADPGIQWGGGDQNGSYIEIREDKLAFDVDVTIRKSLILMCSVWFINGPTVTIAAAGSSLELNGKKGLFAGGGDYRFYGTASVSGGQNPAKPAAKIIIKSGNSLSTSFLTDTPATGELITPATGEKTINNKGQGFLPREYYEGTSRGGYLNWEW
jgi:hypothetical protein